MNSDSLLPNFALPFEENGNSFSLDTTAFVARLVNYTSRMREIALRDCHIVEDIAVFCISQVHDTVLSHSPTALHKDVQAVILPALEEIMQSKYPDRIAEARDGMFKGYAAALNIELQRSIKKPDFTRVPRQSDASATFYMGLPENFFIARTQNPFFGAFPGEEKPAASWKRQIRETTGWLALKNLLGHLGAEVKVIEPDADVLALANSNGIHTPYAKLKFTRDCGLIIDNTIYMGRFDVPTDPFRDSAEVGAALGKNFKNRLAQDGYDFQEINGRISGGNMIYDETKDVLFVGGIITEPRDLLRLASLEAAMPRPTPKTIVIPVPLIAPGNISVVGEVRVREGGEIIEERPTGIQFYDLDTMMTVVDGAVAIYPSATATLTLEIIKRVYGTQNVSALKDSEAALAYPLNLTRFGNVLISPFANNEVRSIFGKIGKQVVAPEDIGLPEGSFSSAAGAVHCMTNSSISTLVS